MLHPSVYSGAALNSFTFTALFPNIRHLLALSDCPCLWFKLFLTVLCVISSPMHRYVMSTKPKCLDTGIDH